jgi:hypothetical protein
VRLGLRFFLLSCRRDSPLFFVLVESLFPVAKTHFFALVLIVIATSRIPGGRYGCRWWFGSLGGNTARDPLKNHYQI